MRSTCRTGVIAALALLSACQGVDRVESPDTPPLAPALDVTASTAPGWNGYPIWMHSYVDSTRWCGGYPCVDTTYMVGTDPFVAQRHAETTIPVVLVPLVMRMPNGEVFDPTVADACDTKSAVDRASRSPLFAESDWVWGGTDLGNTQYIDAFQRAEFWQDANPHGLNPDYHVHLSLRVAPADTIELSPMIEARMACRRGVAGDSTNLVVAWDPTYVSDYPFNLGYRTSPDTLTIYLTRNVAYYWFEGVHEMGPYGQYIVAAYLTYQGPYGDSGDDVAILAHEIAEWMDNPFAGRDSPITQNYIKPCVQFPLEVADPLESAEPLTAKVNGFDYHLPELAFAPWFVGQVPSTALNGWYSNNNTLEVPSTFCE